MLFQSSCLFFIHVQQVLPLPPPYCCICRQRTVHSLTVERHGQQQLLTATLFTFLINLFGVDALIFHLIWPLVQLSHLTLQKQSASQTSSHDQLAGSPGGHLPVKHPSVMFYSLSENGICSSGQQNHDHSWCIPSEDTLLIPVCVCVCLQVQSGTLGRESAAARWLFPSSSGQCSTVPAPCLPTERTPAGLARGLLTSPCRGQHQLSGGLCRVFTVCYIMKTLKCKTLLLVYRAFGKCFCQANITKSDATPACRTMEI